MLVFAHYDRSRLFDFYIKRSRLLQGKRVCLICVLSIYNSAKGGINCLLGVKKLNLIESSILKSILILNDRKIEANLTSIESIYHDDSAKTSQLYQKRIPQFVLNHLYSYIINLNEERIEV